MQKLGLALLAISALPAVALAEPAQMTDEQLATVTAGATAPLTYQLFQVSLASAINTANYAVTTGGSGMGAVSSTAGSQIVSTNSFTVAF